MRWMITIACMWAMSSVGAQDTSFVSVAGGINHDELACALRIHNSYYLIGRSSTQGFGSTDVYMVKTDTMGNVIESYFLGSEYADVATDAVSIGDSLLAITGYTNRNVGNSYDALLMMVDTSGVLHWERTFGGADWDLGYSLFFDPAGYLVISGETYSTGNGGKDAYVIKTNLQGNEIWQRSIGSSLNESFTWSSYYYGNRYLFAGEFEEATLLSDDIVIMWTDTAGNIIDSLMWGGNGNETVNDVYLHTDTTFVVVGGTSSYGAGMLDFLMFRIDTLGNEWWREVFGGPNDEEWNSVILSPQSAAVKAVGYSVSTIGSGAEEVFMTRYALAGFLENLTTWGGNQDERAMEVLPVPVSEYGTIIAAGTTDSYGSGGKDFFLLRTKQVGSVLDSSFLVHGDTSFFLTSVAEHGDDALMLRTQHNQLLLQGVDLISCEVFNSSGKLVYAAQGSGSHTVPIHYLRNGMYIVTATDRHGKAYRKKIVVYQND